MDITKLPEKPYYNLFEVAARWEKLCGESLGIEYIATYIEHGALTGYFKDHGKYYAIPRDAEWKTDEKNGIVIPFPGMEIPDVLRDSDFELFPMLSFDKILISSDELKRIENETETYAPQHPEDIENLPKELRTAIAVYYEFWHNWPRETTSPAKKEDIATFISELMGKKVQPEGQLFSRIHTIAKPEETRTGGAPKTGLPPYKGKSKENP